RRGWTKADRRPVLNRDLWERLLALTKKHEVEFVKVKGHADDAMNNRVDELAVAAMNEARAAAWTRPIEPYGNGLLVSRHACPPPPRPRHRPAHRPHRPGDGLAAPGDGRR